MKIVIDKIDKTEYVNSCKIGEYHSITCYSEYRAAIIASLTKLSIYKNTVYDKGMAGMDIQEVDKIMKDFKEKY